LDTRRYRFQYHYCEKIFKEIAVIVSVWIYKRLITIKVLHAIMFKIQKILLFLLRYRIS